MTIIWYILLRFIPTLALLQSVTCHESSPMIHWIDCRKQIPLTLITTGIDMNNLPAVLHCGTLTVPMDYKKPMSEWNNITLGLAMYRPVNPRGVVFFNPGGSDEATVFAWKAALNQSQEFSALADYDLMMMDVRATYHSNPLNVSLDLFEPLLGSYPASEAEFDVFQKASISMFHSWADLSSPPGILEYIGTKEVVQDLEAVRKALGYNKINFIGASYGSFRAAQYAATYPHRVENFALDAFVPHGVSLFEQAQDHIIAANRGLLRVDSYCQYNSSCFFQSGGRGAFIKLTPELAYQSLVAAAKIKPLPAPSCNNSTGCMPLVTAPMIQQGMLNALLDKPDFPKVLSALRSAIQGDASTFSMAAGDPIPNVPAVWPVPLLCSDYDLGENNFESLARSVNATLKHDVNGIGRTQAWQIQLMCSGWPHPTPANKPLTLPKPMLLVTSDFDVNAPTEWARAGWKHNQDSALMIRHGDDHVSFQYKPSNIITSQYIRTGTLPEPRNETLVSVHTRGMCIGPIADPYQVPSGAIVGDIDSD